MADQDTDQKPTPSLFDKWKSFLFAHDELKKAAGDQPATWMNQDNSGVAKAAAEAGARNDAAKRQASQDLSNRVKGPASK